MLKVSIVMLKGIRCNNLYYLKGNTITKKLTTLIGSNDDSTMAYEAGTHI